jgi:citrate synthase
MAAFVRKTSISRVEAEKITIREHAVEDLIGNRTYGEALYLLLLGKLPTPEQARMLEAIIISVIDHGVKPPSTIATVTVANTGASLNASVAAGILAINKYHGGAVEDAMKAIGSAVAIQNSDGVDAATAAEKLIADYKERGERVSGFGHRFHAADPRTVRLFEFAKELKISGKFIEQAGVMERVLSERSGKSLPVNADGAIAACLLEMNFPPKIANGIFMIARTAGLVAHAVEEQENNPPMRTVDVESYEFE